MIVFSFNRESIPEDTTSSMDSFTDDYSREKFEWLDVI